MIVFEGPIGRMAYAEDCKSFYVGSIPASASKKTSKNEKKCLHLILFFDKRNPLFQRSSVVEQSAVNRSVVGSSPTVGANKERPYENKVFCF